MQAVKLRETGVSAIGCISALADKVWNQYYPAVISEGQIRYMLDKMYSAKSLRHQMEELQHRFYMILLNDKEVGFLSVHNESANNWFINKFYIDQAHASRGLGSAAFNELISILKPDRLQLTVNRQNFKSINFYFKHGFRIERVEDFDIGGGFFMNDFVMTWNKQDRQNS